MTRLKKILGILGVIPLLCLTLTGCVGQVTVEITSPEDGATVIETPITVTGIVSGYPRGEIATEEGTAGIVPEVTVNGIKAQVAEDGSFAAQVELTEGENTIEAKAMLGEQQISDSITITYTPGAPAGLSVEITSPEDGAELTESPATITGNVSDATAAVTVNGIAAMVAEDGTFSAQVELTEGANVIEAVAVLDEQEVSDSVTVTYASSIAGTGTVRYIDLEGGFYGIVSDDGQKYDPINLASDFQQDGLKIRFEAMTRSDLATIHMWGIPIEITNIEKLESELLSVEITSPGDGADLTESPATVTGNISDPAATVMVNGIAAVVAEDGTFSAQVELLEGENTIEAVATLGELEASDSVTVTFGAAPALSVEITSPVDRAELTESPITVEGTVSDAEATVTVNGVEAEVAGDGTFSAQVELTEGENTIEVVAVLDEQEASDSITVTYTAAA